MCAEPLCIRTFAEAIQKKMNAKSDIKDLENGNIMKVRYRTDIHFYELLFEAIVFKLPNEANVSKELVSRLKNGIIEIPEEYLSLAQRKDAAIRAGEFFGMRLVPNISTNSLRIAVDEIAEIIEGDDSLAKTTKKNYKDKRKKLTEADFLGEAFILAVTVGKNKTYHIPRKTSKHKFQTETVLPQSEITLDKKSALTDEIDDEILSHDNTANEILTFDVPSLPAISKYITGDPRDFSRLRKDISSHYREPLKLRKED